MYRLRNVFTMVCLPDRKITRCAPIYTNMRYCNGLPNLSMDVNHQRLVIVRYETTSYRPTLHTWCVTDRSEANQYPSLPGDTLSLPSGGRPLVKDCPMRFQHSLCRRGLAGRYHLSHYISRETNTYSASPFTDWTEPNTYSALG